MTCLELSAKLLVMPILIESLSKIICSEVASLVLITREEPKVNYRLALNGAATNGYAIRCCMRALLSPVTNNDKLNQNNSLLINSSRHYSSFVFDLLMRSLNLTRRLCSTLSATEFRQWYFNCKSSCLLMCLQLIVASLCSCFLHSRSSLKRLKQTWLRIVRVHWLVFVSSCCNSCREFTVKRKPTLSRRSLIEPFKVFHSSLISAMCSLKRTTLLLLARY